MTYNPFSLSGKTVLITGAASGWIGRNLPAIAGAKRDTYPNCRRSDQRRGNRVAGRSFTPIGWLCQ